ncbi:MAG TPA: response regulator [Gammaproteobacteria bacterium]|nr:response regulator [Gammaproteobacteria bacterium]
MKPEPEPGPDPYASSHIKFHKSMRGRFLLFGVLPTIAMLAAIVAYNASNLYSRVRADNEQLLHNLAIELAGEIELTNNRAVMAAQVMALAQEAGLFGQRAESIEYARRVLEFYPEFTGAYFGYEPNADGQDAAALESGAGMAQAVDAGGRFIPYWFRDRADNARIRLEPLVDMETSLYYSGMKQRFEESAARYIVTEPYVYEGKMIVEQTAPIVRDGKFVGIAGVDRALTDMVGFLDRIKLKHNVDVFLISRTGRFIADTLGEKVSLRTLAFEETAYRDLFAQLHRGRNERQMILAPDPFEQTSRYYFVAAPVATGDWTVIMREAEKNVTAPILKNILSSVSIAGAGLLALLMMMLWVTNSSTRRLKKAVQAADMLASGALQKDMTLETQTEDEIGMMNRSFNRVIEAFRDITRVTVAVADGDFSQQVTPRSEHDELARAINRMTERRRRAEQELRDIMHTTEVQHRAASALNELDSLMRCEQSIQPLSAKVINFIARYFALPVASIYIRREGDALEWQAGYACPEGYSAGSVVIGRGLAGQAAQDLRPLEVAEFDDGFRLPTGLGEIRPARLLYFPVILNRRCLGVLELGLLKAMEPEQLEWLEEAANSVAVSIQLALDIERREQIEHELAEAKDVAEAANQAKSGFLANMSHELRTPMNAILGYSEMLMEEAEDEGLDSFTRDLKKIHQAGNHLLTLINDVLDLSKIEAGRMETFAEDADIDALIDQVAGTAQPLMGKNGNKLVIERGEQLGTAHQDVTKLRQSLLNLLSNAAKFTHRGTVTLSVQRSTEQGKDWLTFAVRDTGIGIPADKIDHVFKEFSQADNSTTRNYGGTGLGLPISRRFCQMMGGDLTLQSRPGEGSTFTIRVPATLPGAQTEAASPDVATRSGGETEAMLATGTGPTVLVIDDDPEARDIIGRYLRKDGFNVAFAASGEEGLKLAHSLHPAAITLDVMMPGMDGWSVLRALKVDPVLQDIPVTMLTMMDDRSRGFALGATDYLTKPVDRDSLHHALARFKQADRDSMVLLVEDDAATRNVMQRSLDKTGWQVAEATNGKEALEQLERARPDLVLLDLMMPVMDGFDFLLEMRTRPEWQDIPVIVLTAKDLTDEDRRILSGRVEQIIAKGASSTEQIVARIRQLLPG